MLKVILAPVLTGCLAIAASVAIAEDEGPYDDAIKGRQAMFQLYSFNLGILADMAKGEREYEAALATEAVKNLELATSLGQSAFWPEGSHSDDPGNRENRALPVIWDEQDDVQEKYTTLGDAVADLQAVAGGGVDDLKGAVNDVGGSCKSCHDDYRAERD